MLRIDLLRIDRGEWGTIRPTPTPVGYLLSAFVLV
jgi:hypothetical protein